MAMKNMVRIPPVPMDDLEGMAGWLESMANLYRSFIACVRAKKAGSFTPDMIDFPTVHDGAEGVKFIHACLKSNQEGNVWVEL